MSNLNLFEEISFYKPKQLGELSEEIMDLYESINEVTKSIKGIERASKKKVMQTDLLIDALNIELEQKREEIITLKREKNEQIKDCGNTIQKLIEILDQIDIIYKFAVDSGSTQWMNSLKSVMKVIQKRLSEVDIYEVPALGEMFDEEYHQCIERVKDSTKKQYEIVEVRKKGYRVGTKVIRPAWVVAVE